MNQQLHPIEEAVYSAISYIPRTLEEIVVLAKEKMVIDVDQVRRGIEWLKFKNMIYIHSSSTPANMKFVRFNEEKIKIHAHKDFSIDVSYDDENPSGDWFLKITIPKQPEWVDTKAIAEEARRYIHDAIKFYKENKHED